MNSSVHYDDTIAERPGMLFLRAAIDLFSDKKRDERGQKVALTPVFRMGCRPARPGGDSTSQR